MSEQSQVAVKQGVVFSCTEGSKSPSTSATGRKIVAAALAAVDTQASAQAAKDSKWRSHYGKYFHRLTELATEHPDHAVVIARAGLAEAARNFEFVRGNTATSLTPLEADSTPLFESVTIKGNAKAETHLSVPLNGNVLTGDLLESQIKQWRDDEVLEPEAATVLLAGCQEEAPTLDGQIFILLGAAAEVGPCEQLLRRGATVVAVDIPKPKIWFKLIETAEQSAGTLIVPVRNTVSLDPNASRAQLAEVAGADLLTETPEILQWLKQFSDARCIGCYAYLDGARHVQLAMAMDFLVQHMQSENPQIAYAFMLTPTDSYAVTDRIAKVCAGRGSAIGRLTAKLVSAVSGGRLYASNVRGHAGGSVLIDSILPQQGPNYSLAKRIQRWRATVAQAEGFTVSANLAPATTTRSVTSNKLFEMGYAGCAYFGAMAFAPETTNALMAAMLLHDLSHVESDEDATETAPERLFSHNAIHGGFWTAGYQTRTVLLPAVVLGAMQRIGLPKLGKSSRRAGSLNAAMSH